MRYCTVCGEDISRRGNRATKCEFCQRQDAVMLQQYKNVIGLGSGTPNKPGGCISVGSTKKVRDMLVNQHKYAILPEDNADTRQNAMEIERRRQGKRSKREVYKEWKYGCI